MPQSKHTSDIAIATFMSAILSIPGFGHVKLKKILDETQLSDESIRDKATQLDGNLQLDGYDHIGKRSIQQIQNVQQTQLNHSCDHIQRDGITPLRFHLETLIHRFCKDYGYPKKDLLARMKHFENIFRSGAITPVMYWSNCFPKGFWGLRDAPQMIFVSGDPSVLSSWNITIVGTRKHTLYGGKVVRRIIDSIRDTVPDTAIVSGLAYGIDSQTHQYTLNSGLRTIAVVAGGIDKGYPKRNERLYDEIIRNGVVLSEFPPGVDIIKGMFPMRNRLLAALSKMVIVVESSSKGGSMITARHAAEMGVDVLAVPGDIDRNVAEGCNLLIAQGAIPLYSFGVFEEYLEVKRGAC